MNIPLKITVSFTSFGFLSRKKKSGMSDYAHCLPPHFKSNGTRLVISSIGDLKYANFGGRVPSMPIQVLGIRRSSDSLVCSYNWESRICTGWLN